MYANFQYRIYAEFYGEIYHPRQYKRKFYETYEEAETDLPIALDYYKSQPYKNSLKRLSIQRTELPKWETVREVRA